MNENIHPPCNSLLATFFELNFEVCQKRASSCLKTLVGPKRTQTVVRAAVSPSPFDVPEENNTGKRGDESSVGGPEGPNEGGGVCETESGTEADVEDKDVDVVGGVDEIRVSGCESEGITLSKTLRRKRLPKNSVSDGVVDTAHLPQKEFLNLQHIPLTFLFEFLRWPDIEFFGLVVLRALKHEDDFVRLLCFNVCSLRRTSGSFKWASIASDRRAWFRVWGWRADFRRRSQEEEEESSERAPESPLTAVLES